MKELWTEMCVLKKWYQRPLTGGLKGPWSLTRGGRYGSPETAPGAHVVMVLAAGLSELLVRPCLHWRLRAGGEVNWMERILSSKGWGGL